MLLHRKIPGICIPRCLGSEIDVNLAFADIEVGCGGSFNAKLGLVSKYFFLASVSLIDLSLNEVNCRAASNASWY